MDQPSCGALKPVVALARPCPKLLAELIGEAEALLGDRSRDRRTVSDDVNQVPERIAGEQTLDEVIDQAAVEQVVDEPADSITVERLRCQRMEARAVQKPLHFTAVQQAVQR